MPFLIHWKFSVLLAAMLLQLALRAVLIEYSLGVEAVELMGACLILPAALAMYQDRRQRNLVLIFGFLVIGLIVQAAFAAGAELGFRHLLSHGASALFLTYMILTILRELFRRRDVTHDTLVGAFCGYVLIGIVFTEVYCAMQILDPVAINGTNAGFGPNAPQETRWQICQYFSFATLTTLGYGDIAPVSAVARSLAMFQAICGQFYLAVLVAGLVGIHASQRLEEKSDGGSGD